MPPRLDLSGKKFGRWTVVDEAPSVAMPSRGTARKWNCVCECGIIRAVFQSSLSSGMSVSCGCYRLEQLPSNRDSAKGLRIGCNRSDNRYNVWSMMIQRCYEKNHDNFELYGALGKFVCERWLEPKGQGFLNFCEDMGERPLGTSLDRIDNKGSYEPENCRWADQTTQNINRGTNRNNTSGCKGVTWHSECSKWCAQIGVNYSNIVLGYFEDWFEAVCARKSGEITYFKAKLE